MLEFPIVVAVKYYIVEILRDVFREQVWLTWRIENIRRYYGKKKLRASALLTPIIHKLTYIFNYCFIKINETFHNIAIFIISRDKHRVRLAVN